MLPPLSEAFDGAVNCDAFLGGQLKIWQPKQGYRAGVDPVLLAASVPVSAGQAVLDLGCGVGVAGLCVAARCPGVAVTGLELQADYAALAARNAAENAADFSVVTGDLTAMPAELRQMQFDHVIANPPYFDRDASSRATDAGREVAMGQGVALAEWVRVAAKRTRAQGYVTFVHRAERLGDLLAAFDAAGLGSVQILPIVPRKGRAAQLVLVRGRKGGRAALRLQDGLRMHKGARHVADTASYRAEIERVLRGGAGLNWPV